MTIQAGPELDRLIAEKVMGFTDIRKMNGCDWYSATQEGRADRVLVGSDSERGFAPSTNIAHAWEVVEHLRKIRFLALELTPKTEPIGWWTASWIDVGDASEDDYELVHDVYVHAPTAPHAICLAALKAVSATS